MYCLIVAIVLQAGSVNLGKAPATVPVGAAPSPDLMQIPQIGKARNFTAPDIDANTQETHAQMERDIGGQGEAIAGLTEKVNTLEKLREDPDRKDIEDLKNSRNHIEWTWGVIALFSTGALAMFGFLTAKFGGRIWEEMIKPRVRRLLLQTTENPQQ